MPAARWECWSCVRGRYGISDLPIVGTANVLSPCWLCQPLPGSHHYFAPVLRAATASVPMPLCAYQLQEEYLAEFAVPTLSVARWSHRRQMTLMASSSLSTLNSYQPGYRWVSGSKTNACALKLSKACTLRTVSTCTILCRMCTGARVHYIR